MSRSYVPFGAAVALCLATASCAAPSNDAQAAVPTPPVEIEEPLALTVDALDVRHGSLRIVASMEDGSADVEMRLGESCQEREVGHGFATRAGFAWSLSREEIARAIECGLVVKVHAVDEEGQHVRRVAQLPVSVALEADSTEVVSVRSLESEGDTTKVTFVAPVSAYRLHVAGTVIGAESDDDGEIMIGSRRRPRRAFLSSFVVDNADLARSMLARRHITLLGEDFLATITVGSTVLDVSEPEPETAAEPEPESSTDEPQHVLTPTVIEGRSYEPNDDVDDGCDDCGAG